ncbi:hypothetical protein ABB07_38470 [Streptomyces incarnatus]|uniref:Uncharacterized protein n=1 Tax=Streptomyces incarnatus TaxID=665007 RepID=A0ABN4GT58_9ACTN|nr:hypothetical protein [Streptomyces incarnatus]AKJ15727.1 hypothetical protein ABB07_38470 [Streptomyces incarnatus]
MAQAFGFFGAASESVGQGKDRPGYTPPEFGELHGPAFGRALHELTAEIRLQLLEGQVDRSSAEPVFVAGGGEHRVAGDA